MQGKIDMGHGRALLSLSAAKQIETANLVAHKQLSVRETERLVHRIEHPVKKHPKRDRDLLRLQENISETRRASRHQFRKKRQGNHRDPLRQPGATGRNIVSVVRRNGKGADKGTDDAWQSLLAPM